MPSFFDNPAPWDSRTHGDTSARRHTVDHGTSRTQPTSRESSVSSTISHQSEPVRRSSANDAAKRRTSSTASSSDNSSTSKSSGLKSLFGKNKGEKPKKEKEKIVITSRHAAAVKSKLAVDPNYRRLSESKITGVEGIQKITHSAAEVQEMRHPHSGPPMVRSGSDKANQPTLSKILSGDEEDEEDELDRIRNHLMNSKVSEVKLVQVPENETLETHVDQEEKEEATAKQDTEQDDGKDSVDTDIRTDQEGSPRQKTHRISIGGGWMRNDSGKWTR